MDLECGDIFKDNAIEFQAAAASCYEIISWTHVKWPTAQEVIQLQAVTVGFVWIFLDIHK